MKRIELANPAGMEVTEDGVMEIRGEVSGKPAVIAIPAKVSAHLIAGLVSVADAHAAIEANFPQNPTVLPLIAARVRTGTTTGTVLLDLRTANGFQLTFSVPAHRAAEIGTAISNSGTEDAPETGLH